MGKPWKQYQTLFWGAPKSLQMVIAAIKLKDTYSLEGVTNLDSILMSRDITLPTKVHLVKAMGFFQARILEWVAVLVSRGSSQPRDQTQRLQSPVLAGGSSGKESVFNDYTLPAG